MTVFQVSRECRGVAEAGGIKDVVREMAESWNALGARSPVLMPLYGFLKERYPSLPVVFSGHLDLGLTLDFQVHSLVDQGLEVFLFDLPGFAQKAGIYTYTKEEERQNPFHKRGAGHVDAPWMNVQFQKAVAEFLLSLPLVPDVLHCHDGHTGWLPVLLKTNEKYRAHLGRMKTLVTIHNAGVGYHQEIPDWDPSASQLGLSREIMEGCRIAGGYDPLAAAGLYSVVNTVSPFYAGEIMDPENQGQVGGLGDFYRERGIHLYGQFNGFLLDEKDPRVPEKSGLPLGFDPENNPREGKLLCRQALARKLLYPREHIWGNLDASTSTVLFAMQSRLTSQKGVELMISLIPRLLQDPRVSLVVMGQGDREYEQALENLGREWESSGRFGFINVYDESYSPLVFAAGDFFLIPSLFEPCGLTDLKALAMGTIPIVHKVGGLQKITHLKTGLVVENLAQDWEAALKRAVDLAQDHPDKLADMQKEGFRMVKEDFNWKKILTEGYQKLFQL